MNWEFSSAEAYCHFKMAEASEQINERVRTVGERSVVFAVLSYPFVSQGFSFYGTSLERK